MVMATLACAAPEASSVSALKAMRTERILPLASSLDCSAVTAAPWLSVPRIQYARIQALVPVASGPIVNGSRGTKKAAEWPIRRNSSSGADFFASGGGGRGDVVFR